ncbi:tRNA threonylcarbamoyladenosine dehydratase [uncultured Porphyromonas sp.]|uniref:tRNA threonylcarbamoyladenosine dehydratase n=1 Tax=uncultured Porphyromonas sp. TaxID=159274 RepID=UPI0026233E89|nr:tRNA threonylcarbamoyladenosine dehydratase [uncultured Porphyromonas sp.]
MKEMEEDHTLDRLRLLVGAEGCDRLSRVHVLVLGLGGVGGFAAEMIARSGVGQMTIVDADVVNQSNINRQIIATQPVIGQSKAALWHDRLLSINPALRLEVIAEYLRDERMEEVLSAAPYDFVIDAIDTLAPKVFAIAYMQQHGIPFVSAMGAGAKTDPTKIRVARMDKSFNDPLAKMIRKRLRHLGVKLNFPVVFSTELPVEEAIVLTEGEQNKKSTPGTISYMPPMVGGCCAYVALDHLLHPNP